MAPRTQEQFKEMRSSSKRKIMDAALVIFAEEGIHSTTISQIAKKAGVSTGLLYNYFDGKDELLNAIIQDGLEKLLGLVDTEEQSDDPIKNMKNMLRFTTKSAVEHSNYWRLVFSLFLQPAVFEKATPMLIKVREELLSEMGELFKALGSDNPREDAMLLGAQLDGLYLNYVMDPSLIDIEKLTERLITIYVNNFNQTGKK